MNTIRRFGASVLAVVLLAGMATAQTPPPTAPAQPSAQAQFDSARDLYVKDMGIFKDAVIGLREANKAGPNGVGMVCTYANLTVVGLGSAQAQLETMIALMEAAHQDVGAYRADYKENAEQFALRKAALDKSGCG